MTTRKAKHKEKERQMKCKKQRKHNQIDLDETEDLLEQIILMIFSYMYSKVKTRCSI